ncbi:hypothetical protein [Streptomyces sioyaensis]|uniref:hypothetical protein n=1 Tax=Streptomyces sioyaensis TaxID=67364 RepID=UPI00193ECC6B|nr:hypothetical protein [Streptomyces sioyaensis]
MPNAIAMAPITHHGIDSPHPVSGRPADRPTGAVRAAGAVRAGGAVRGGLEDSGKAADERGDTAQLEERRPN